MSEKAYSWSFYEFFGVVTVNVFSFYSPFSGTARWASARRELLDLWCKGRL